MCDEVIFRGRYLHTIVELRKALDGGEIVPNRQCGYTDDDLLPHCCLCPVDLAQTAAENGMRLWPSSEGEWVFVLSDDRHPEPGRYVRLEMRGEESHAVLSAPMPSATIECQCIDGVWYWGMSFSTGMGGEGLAPLPKWQRTASSEEEAVLAAADHMRRRIERNQTWKAAGADILRWLEGVEARMQQASAALAEEVA